MALNGCGCEPSEQRPLELGGIPSVHNGCSPGAPVGGGAVTLAVVVENHRHRDRLRNQESYHQYILVVHPEPLLEEEL